LLLEEKPEVLLRCLEKILASLSPLGSAFGDSAGRAFLREGCAIAFDRDPPTSAAEARGRCRSLIRLAREIGARPEYARAAPIDPPGYRHAVNTAWSTLKVDK
jgi:hypothetical protein